VSLIADIQIKTEVSDQIVRHDLPLPTLIILEPLFVLLGTTKK
jgi:hypothetical protein